MTDQSDNPSNHERNCYHRATSHSVEDTELLVKEWCWILAVLWREWKGVFYLMMHSTNFIYGYMVKDHSVREETRCHHMGYSFRLAARVLLYAPSHRQDSTYHSLCYTSQGALSCESQNREFCKVCWAKYTIWIECDKEIYPSLTGYFLYHAKHQRITFRKIKTYSSLF